MKIRFKQWICILLVILVCILAYGERIIGNKEGFLDGYQSRIDYEHGRDTSVRHGLNCADPNVHCFYGENK